MAKQRAVPCTAVPSAPAPAVAASAVAVAPSPPPAEPDVPRDPAALAVAFDCFSTLEEKRAESLGAWHSGGPDGSAWNVEGAPLRCELKFKAPCAGSATLWVLGNTKQLTKRDAAVKVGDNVLEWQLPAKIWDHALEGTTEPYSVLLLAVGGFLTCPLDGTVDRYHFADAFMAGFSGGE